MLGSATRQLNLAIAVSSIHVFIRLGPALEVKIGTYDQAGGVIVCL
jgi:hypothetical protein